MDGMEHLNGGVFWGRAGPRKGCSAMDGMEHLKQDRRIVARSRNHCCSPNTAVCNSGVGELHFTVDY